MSSTIIETPTLTSAVMDATRVLGARAASRAIAPSDVATHKFTDELEAPAATIWRQRQYVEAERVMSKIKACISAAGAVPSALLAATGMAVWMASPVLLPVGALMVVTGLTGLFACAAYALYSERKATRAQGVARTLDRHFHRELAKSGALLKKPKRPNMLRALSQPAPETKAAVTGASKMPGSFPGDFAVVELLTHDKAAQRAL